MNSEFWIILLIVILAITIFVSIGIVVYYKITTKLKNGLVARIHMADSTIKSYRYDVIPSDNKITITETDYKGNETKFVYLIREECIERGSWGRYIDYDYHIMTPINPKQRTNKDLFSELKELYKLIGSLLDTDLHVKLLRNSKFEDFVRSMLMIILIISILGMCFAGAQLGVTLLKSSGNNNDCVLKLDNSTWQTIYIASHTPPVTLTPTNTQPPSKNK